MSELFRFDVSPWELIVRGTLMYWFLFALFRFVLRHDVGSLAIADVLLVVLIADAAQNAMSGGYDSVSGGVVLVATIAAWNQFSDVKTAYMESDGEISVIRVDGEKSAPAKAQRQAGVK